MAQKLLIDKMIAEARSYHGVKWRHLGRTRFSIDCIGLLIAAMRGAGVELSDRVDYGREPWDGRLETELTKQLGEPVADGMRAGDIVTLRGIGQPGAGHVGIVAEANGYLTLIHSYNADANCRVTEHRIDDEWTKRITLVYRPFP